jgi:hypothetical protein
MWTINTYLLPGIMMHACNPRRLRQEDGKFKLAWATYRDPVSKKTKEFIE